MFSYNGDVTVGGVTYPDGAEALERMGDYNCNHYKTDVILGVSRPGFDRDWLAEQKAGDAELVEFEGRKKTRYEWTKAQRRIESEIRTQTGIKTMATAAGDKALARQADEKIDFYRKKYDELCEKTGLQPMLERMGTVKAKTLTGAGGSGIMKMKVGQDGAVDVHYIGKIDRNIYKCVTKDIRTDEVIITDTQIRHIKERHPNDYERFNRYFAEIVEKPDYIIEANKPNTALILKEIQMEREQFKAVLRIATSTDNPSFKNSIITFMKIDNKEWKRIVKNKKTLYKSE